MCDQHVPYWMGEDLGPDNWIGISDRKKRKQIQDRLAQRSRRKRLADLKKAGNSCHRSSTAVGQANACGIPRQPHPSQDEETRIDSGAASGALAATTVPAITTAAVSAPFEIPVSGGDSQVSSLAAMSISASSQASPATHSSVSPAAVDCLISHSNNTVFTALFKNGRVLGIPCGTQITWKTSMRGPETPVPLQPTMLQRTVMHTSWIDRFPFPRMRDNFIRLNDAIDEEDFLTCLFDTHSFTIVPGTMSWDPDGWIIGKEFREKWGFLFY